MSGVRFGADQAWNAEVTAGWRDVATGKLGATTARFSAGGDSFVLNPEDTSGGGWVGRVALKMDQTYGALAFEAGGERRDQLTIYDVRLTAHFTF